MSRTDWDAIWYPDQAIAAGVFQAFNYAWPDGKKRYLRVVSLQNRQRMCLVQVWLRDKTGAPWRQDVILASEFTHTLTPAHATQTRTVFTWQGDVPIKGEVRVHCYDLEVGDELFCVLLVEEDKI